MAGKVTVKADAPKIAAYKVSGKTLAEIWEDIKKNGPKDGGKSRAGFTRTPVDLPNSYKFDEEENDKPKKKDDVEWKITVKSGEIKVGATIQMPDLDSDKELSEKAKKEWARFVKELKAHEDEHVAATTAEAEAVAEEITKLEGVGSGKDKKAALKVANAEFAKAFKAAFDGGKFEKRLKKVNEDLDTGGHGPVLDTAID